MEEIVLNDMKIITGITIAEQKAKARFILENEVIPREELYQIRKREGRLKSQSGNQK